MTLVMKPQLFNLFNAICIDYLFLSFSSHFSFFFSSLFFISFFPLFSPCFFHYLLIILFFSKLYFNQYKVHLVRCWEGGLRITFIWLTFSIPGQLDRMHLLLQYLYMLSIDFISIHVCYIVVFM